MFSQTRPPTTWSPKRGVQRFADARKITRATRDADLISLATITRLEATKNETTLHGTCTDMHHVRTC